MMKEQKNTLQGFTLQSVLHWYG